MSLKTITPVRFKATEEWEQKLELEKNGLERQNGREFVHFDRNFSFSKMAIGLGLGYLNFNVKLETSLLYQSFIIIKTESKETFIVFKIMIEYSAGGKSGSFTRSLCLQTDVTNGFVTGFQSAGFVFDCPVFKDFFKANA